MTVRTVDIKKLARNVLVIAVVVLPLRAYSDELLPDSIPADAEGFSPGREVDDVDRAERLRVPGQPPNTFLSPFELNAFFIVDASQSLRGGQTVHRGTTRHLFEMTISAPTMPLFGWSGGTLNAAFQSQAGLDASSLIGDLQVLSNIDADGRNQVSELWYEHVWEDTPWRVLVGKVDANTQFAFVENGLTFLQSSMGFSPTIFVMPTYPDPAFSANVFYEPDEGFFTGVGIYDGSLAQGIRTGSRGVGHLFRGSDVFAIGKVGWRWNAGVALADDSASLPGRFAAGAWFHNGQFDRFDGATQSGTGGVYLLVDQTIFRESDDPEDNQGLGVFAQYGFADPDVSQIAHHLGTGFTWTGAIPGRNQDALGLGLSWAGLSQRPGAGFAESFELSTELFYSVHASEFASVVFDLQHIVNPNGRNDISDALVGTLRLILAY